MSVVPEGKKEGMTVLSEVGEREGMEVTAEEPVKEVKTDKLEKGNGKIKNGGDEEDDSMMIGVVFDESDLETDHDNKLQLYSDVEAAVGDSDAGGLGKGEVDKGAKNKKKSANREPSRLSLEERIKCIRLCSRYSSYADAQKAWRQAYDTEPPCRKTLSTIDKKFERTGSVADLIRTGRPKSTRTETVIARVEEAISQDPSKSIRTLAKELGIHQASVHRIKKEFEDKRNTLKMENRKLRDRLNEALKRIVLLEKRLTQSQAREQAEVTAILPSGVEPKYETLVLTTPDGIATSGLTSLSTDSLLDSHSGSSLPTIIALNNSNSQVLRLPQGQETIHIITLPSSTSSSASQSQQQQHHVLSLDDASFQLSIPNSSSASSTVIPITLTNTSVSSTPSGLTYLTSTGSTSSNSSTQQDSSFIKF